MTEPDGYTDEMGRFSDISDRDADRLFAGVDSLDPKLEGAARFLEDLSRAVPEAPTDSLESAHVASMLEAAHLLAEKGDPAERPASKASGLLDEASGLPKWRRNVMVKKMFVSTWAKVAAGALALLTVLVGTAFAGILPDPVQSAVAGVAGQVGIGLPNPAAEAADADEANKVEVFEADEIEAPDVEDVDADEAADVEDADDQGEDADEAHEADDEDAYEADEADDEDADEAHEADDEDAYEADDGFSHDEADEADDDATDDADSHDDEAEDAESNDSEEVDD